MTQNTYTKFEDNAALFYTMQVNKTMYYFIATLAGAIVLALVWAAVFKIDEVIKADAYIRPIETISNIQVVIDGEIVTKNYTHNCLVQQGDILLEIDVKAQRTDLENLRVLQTEYENDMADNTHLKFYMQNRYYDNTTMRSERANIMIKAWESEYTRLKLDFDQSVTNKKREDAKPESMKAQQSIDDLETEKIREKTYFVSWINTKLLETDTNIKQAQKQVEAIRGQILGHERAINNATVRAPINGYVDESLPLNIGDYILAGQSILRIIPQSESSIKVVLQIRAIDIARLKVGQKVVLRFPGLPPSDFGKLDAVINLIPADITQMTGGIPTFLVEAKLERTYLLATNGETFQLHSGMTALAKVVLRQETVLRTILHKLEYINA